MPVVLAVDAAAEGRVGADADVATAVDVLVLQGVTPGLSLGVHAQADLADEVSLRVVLAGDDPGEFFGFTPALDIRDIAVLDGHDHGLGEGSGDARHADIGDEGAVGAAGIDTDGELARGDELHGAGLVAVAVVKGHAQLADVEGQVSALLCGDLHLFAALEVAADAVGKFGDVLDLLPALGHDAVIHVVGVADAVAGRQQEHARAGGARFAAGGGVQDDAGGEGDDGGGILHGDGHRVGQLFAIGGLGDVSHEHRLGAGGLDSAGDGVQHGGDAAVILGAGVGEHQGFIARLEFEAVFHDDAGALCEFDEFEIHDFFT